MPPLSSGEQDAGPGQQGASKRFGGAPAGRMQGPVQIWGWYSRTLKPQPHWAGPGPQFLPSVGAGILLFLSLESSCCSLGRPGREWGGQGVAQALAAGRRRRIGADPLTAPETHARASGKPRKCRCPGARVWVTQVAVQSTVPGMASHPALSRVPVVWFSCFSPKSLLCSLSAFCIFEWMFPESKNFWFSFVRRSVSRG